MSKHQVAIIGGGSVGFSVAYQLAKLGINDVVVLDRDSLVKGATGRNAGGVRAQWSTAGNIELAKRSQEMFQNFAKETGHNLFYRKSGYLFIVKNEEKLAMLRASAKFQNEHEVRTRMIEPSEVEKIVPGINLNGIVGASWNPDDSILFPWPLVWGWKEQAELAGIRCHTHTQVTSVKAKKSGFKLQTTKGDFESDFVVNAAGAWSKQVSAMAGVDIPNKPERHEILVTEPLKQFLQPMLVDLSTGLYLNQDMRGEIIGGLGTHHHESLDWNSSFQFVQEFARQTTKLLPSLRAVKILRQWAGSYDKTPDAVPNLGRSSDGPENFLQANGFSGHGMMISPMVGKVLAQTIAGHKPDIDLSSYDSTRFGNPDLKMEGMVIG